MEDIIEKGEFHFKETVILGDPLEKSEKLGKVLGMRSPAEEEMIRDLMTAACNSMAMKNFSEKPPR